MDVTALGAGPGPSPSAQPVTRDVSFGEGFHVQESDGFYEFRWMELEARLDFAADPADRFLELQVLSEFRDLSQELTCTSGSHEARFSLRSGWAPVSIAVPAGAENIGLSVNKVFPRAYYSPVDRRTLTVRVQAPELHSDARRHHNVVTQQSNLVRNSKEMLAGRTVLESTPPRLGIDMHGVCNVKPPCVYCAWDSSKEMEGEQVDAPFTVETLRAWGPFFDNSTTLINCSIGEPFMMRNIDDLLDEFGAGGKELELTTNGQIMTDRTIRRLIGRPIKLHISLDSGTPETYAKLRNNRFDAIVKNLERLIEAKGGPGRYPYVLLVFMPMKVNLHELPAVVELSARLRVDRLVLRPLNFAEGSALSWDRAGYRFEYMEELLPFDELVRASGRAAELCERAGVPLSDQMDFGGSMGAEFEQWFEEGRRSARPVEETPASSAPPAAPGVAAPRLEPPAPAAPAEPSPAPAGTASAEPDAPIPSLGGESKPACSEPWDSLYILRRGVMPCCYGGKPIAKMDEYRETWNSPVLQEIRRDLAQGRFNRYCLESPSCPIVRKTKAHEPPAPPAAEPRRTWHGRVRARAAAAWHTLKARTPAAGRA